MWSTKVITILICSENYLDSLNFVHALKDTSHMGHCATLAVQVVRPFANIMVHSIIGVNIFL